jgi:hypothetical protein
VISGSAGDSSLSDKKTYPNFMRTIGTTKDDAFFFVSVLQKLGWKYVAMITSSFLPVAPEFYDTCRKLNITVINKVIDDGNFQSFKPLLEDIKASGVTGIMTNIYNNDFPNVDVLFNASLALGMFDPPYTWVLSNANFDLNKMTSFPTQKKLGILYQKQYQVYTQLPVRQMIYDRWNADYCVNVIQTPNTTCFTEPDPPLNIGNDNTKALDNDAPYSSMPFGRYSER